MQKRYSAIALTAALIAIGIAALVGFGVYDMAYGCDPADGGCRPAASASR